MHKCHCGVEFEPTKRQLGQLKRGKKIHCSIKCQLIFRDGNRPRPAKKLYLHCEICGHRWTRRTRHPKQCPACKSVLWETGRRPYLHEAEARRKRQWLISKTEASLHCVKYYDCMTEAAKTNKRLKCHKCDHKRKTNVWMKTGYYIDTNQNVDITDELNIGIMVYQ